MELGSREGSTHSIGRTGSLGTRLGIEKPPRVKQEGGLLGFPLVGTTGGRAAPQVITLTPY